jgi:hypothetical protein
MSAGAVAAAELTENEPSVLTSVRAKPEGGHSGALLPSRTPLMLSKGPARVGAFLSVLLLARK